MSDIPLPNMGRNVSDVSRLVKEQQADGSLEKVLCLAGKSEKGYAFVEGILVQNAEDGLGGVKQEMEKADELVSLSEVFDFHDSYFEEDPVPTPVEELGEGGVEIPLPELVGVGSDSGMLVIEQQEDESVVQEQQAAGFLDQVMCSDQKILTEFRFVQNHAEHSVAL